MPLHQKGSDGPSLNPPGHDEFIGPMHNRKRYDRLLAFTHTRAHTHTHAHTHTRARRERAGFRQTRTLSQPISRRDYRFLVSPTSKPKNRQQPKNPTKSNYSLILPKTTSHIASHTQPPTKSGLTLSYPTQYH